jgi:hypothetical protein
MKNTLAYFAKAPKEALFDLAQFREKQTHFNDCFKIDSQCKP